MTSFDTYSFSQKQRRMLEDDSLCHVNEEEVMALLLKMKQARFPKSEIIRIRKKYDRFIHDKEKELMTRLNLNYDEHDIEFNRSGTFFINGYTEAQWCLLNVDSFIPKSIKAVRRSVYTLKEAGKFQEAKMVEEKYSSYIASEMKKCEAKLRDKLSLPDTAEISSTNHLRVDNLPLYEWKCFNDPSYVPPRHLLTRLLEKYGNYEDLTEYYFLFDKYSAAYAYEDGEPPVTLEDAKDIFDKLFNKPK